MITGRQIRAARTLLDWTAADLAEKAGLTRETVSRIEVDTVQAREGSIEKMMHTFDQNGIEFIGERGVARRDDEIMTIRGENAFVRVLDDVVTTLKGKEGAESLFACVDDSVSPPIVVENYRRLRKAGIGMRSLVKEGDTYLMGRIDEYRYLPKKFFHNNPIVIYGDKLATMVLHHETGEDAGAIIIRNKHIAAAQRNLFNLVWSVSQPPHETTAKVRYE